MDPDRASAPDSALFVSDLHRLIQGTQAASSNVGKIALASHLPLNYQALASPHV